MIDEDFKRINLTCRISWNIGYSEMTGGWPGVSTPPWVGYSRAAYELTMPQYGQPPLWLGNPCNEGEESDHAQTGRPTWERESKAETLTFVNMCSPFASGWLSTEGVRVDSSIGLHGWPLRKSRPVQVLIWDYDRMIGRVLHWKDCLEQGSIRAVRKSETEFTEKYFCYHPGVK